MTTSPFAKMPFGFFDEQLFTFDLAQFDRTLHVIKTLKIRLFLEKTRSELMPVTTRDIRRAKSSPGSATNDLSNRRKVYPVRFAEL